MSANPVEQLWQARVEGMVVSSSDVPRPVDEDAAYELQRELTAFAAQHSGARVVGFKVGSTTEEGVAALQLTQPFFGPLVDSYCYKSGDDVPLSEHHQVLIETEIAIGLATDLPAGAREYGEADVQEATAWIAPAFELVAIRLDLPLAGNGPYLIADGGVNAAFVLGQKTDSWDGLDLSQHPVTLNVNGSQTANGHSGMSMFGNPFNVVAWLANHPQLKQRGLKAGDMVTTGTCTGMTPLKTGDEVHADLGALGQINMRQVQFSR